MIDESTEVVLNYHDSHLPDGAFEVTFEDVGGLGKQIKLIRELVQLPLTYPHVYRHLGINPPRGIILYGPPGSGKSHLARAVANEVDARFYYINGPDVIGTYTGETEANLRRMFNEAGHHSPSIIFIDELDAMAPKRGETGAHSDTRTVTQLLSLMDGLKRVDSVIVIGTTNRIDAVDPAFRRPGRFDREIFIGPPDAAGRREILEIHSREMPLSDDAQDYLDEIAKRTHGFLGADLMELCRDAGLSRLRRSAGNLQDHRAAFRIPLQDMRVEREDFELALSQTRPSALRETLISIPDVSWSDIGGLEAVKERLQETVELPLRNPQLLTASGLPPHVGIVLYGPSGTGKTLLAKALANECGVNFISVDGPEIFTKWLGESEEGVRQIFRIARQVAPTVVFFDQLEAIAPIRGQNVGSMTTDRVVSQLLAELDGVEQLSRVIVLGATNRIDLIDPSILRPGRFGVHIAVGLPDADERRGILRICLRTAVSGGERSTREHHRRGHAAHRRLFRRADQAALRHRQTHRDETHRLHRSGRADCRRRAGGAEGRAATRKGKHPWLRWNAPASANARRCRTIPTRRPCAGAARRPSATRTARSWSSAPAREVFMARQGKLRYFLDPIFYPETPLLHWRVFTHEIRTKSGKHRHQGGLLIYVLEGRGYSIVEGERMDWEKGDLVLLPLNPERSRAPAFQSRPGKAVAMGGFHPSSDPGIPGVGFAAGRELAGFQRLDRPTLCTRRRTYPRLLAQLEALRRVSSVFRQ